MRARDRVLVAAGGGLGALLRVALVDVVGAAAPVTTLAINVVGALLLGVLLAATNAEHPARPLLGTGVLGGFTTYSALAVQVAEATPVAALALAAASLVLGLSAALLGLRHGPKVIARRGRAGR